MMAPLSVNPLLPVSHAKPESPLECRVALSFAEVLNLESVGMDDDFFALGGDSLAAMDLSIKLGSFISKRNFFKAMVETATVRALSAYAVRPSETQNHLVSIQNSGARVPIVFIHAIGGTVFFYNQLAHRLGRDQPFYAIQSLGFSEDEAPLCNVAQMAEKYAELLRPVVEKGPFIIGGYSFGCLVASELTSLLERRSCPPVGVLLIAPPSPQPEQNFSSNNVDARAQALLEAFLGREKVSDSFSEILLRIYRAHLHAEIGYVPKNWHASTALFLGNEDPWAENSRDLWSPFAKGGIDERRVPGTHVSIVLAPDVDILAKVITDVVNTRFCATQICVDWAAHS